VENFAQALTAAACCAGGRWLLIVTTISQATQRMRDPRLTLTLAAPSVLISLTIALALAAYIQARPNTASLVSDGEFDANRVFADLKRLVSFGPRPPGSRALEEGREFIAAELRAAAPASS
jgi:hypothetical protein